jgi:hypothetical protein
MKRSFRRVEPEHSVVAQPDVVQPDREHHHRHRRDERIVLLISSRARTMSSRLFEASSVS